MVNPERPHLLNKCWESSCRICKKLWVHESTNIWVEISLNWKNLNFSCECIWRGLVDKCKHAVYHLFKSEFLFFKIQTSLPASFVRRSSSIRPTLPNASLPLWRAELAVGQKHAPLPSIVPPPPPALSLPPLGDCRWASGQWHTVTRVSPQALCMVFNQVEAGGPLDCIDPEGWSIGELSLCNFTPLKPPPFEVVLLAHSPHV